MGSAMGGVKPVHPVRQQPQGVCGSSTEPPCLCLLENQTTAQGDRLLLRFRRLLSPVQKSEEVAVRCKAAPTKLISGGSWAMPVPAAAAQDAPGHGGVGGLRSWGLRCGNLTLQGAG